MAQINTPTQSKGALLDASTAVAQNAAKMIGENFTQGVGVTPNSVSPTPPPTTPDASKVGGANPLVIQPQTSDTTSAGISGASDATVDNHQSVLDQQLADKVAADTAAKTESKNSLTSVMNSILGVQSSRNTEEANAKIPEYTQASNDTFNALQASKRAQQKEIEAIQANGSVSSAAMNAAITNTNRKYASEQADLSISLDVANRNLTGAQSMVDKKIANELEPLKTQLDFQTTFFNDNKDQLSKDEQNQLTQMISENKQAVDDKNAVGDVLKTAITNGVQLSADILKQVGQAKNANDAYSILAKNGISLAKPISVTGGGGGLGSGSTLGDAQLAAQAIMNGNQPPTLTGLYSKGLAVKAELERQGYDFTAAAQDWTAMQKRIATMNSASQVRLEQAVNFSYDSLDIIEQLNKEWQGGNYPLLNKANLALAKSGVYGQDAQSLATRFEAQINDLTSELGTVYKGGNSSTDESLKLAAGNLSSNWSQKTLTDAINLARTNLQIRKNSIANSSSIAGNQYSEDTSTSSPSTIFDNLFKQYGGQ